MGVAAVGQGELHRLRLELLETDLADFKTALHRTASADSRSTRLTAVDEVLSRFPGRRVFAHGGDYSWADGAREPPPPKQPTRCENAWRAKPNAPTTHARSPRRSPRWNTSSRPTLTMSGYGTFRRAARR
ncbi:hypothetical protein GCM10010129_07730 [Streptomyces fumigatiscleroticus]|nr:hypothetical protein GCM10010129_07730 [Streptomyces fumigatiscleroticus]